jgi:transposase
MNEISRVAIDTSKSVFTLHAVDGQDRLVLRRNLRRQDLVAFFTKLPAVEVALEACGGSHHWGRTLQSLGHQVRLIPPQYVKPFVKRAKNDRNDAEAISEAAARPGMRQVPVKSAAAQAQAMLLSVQELLVRQRTQLVNALRGHATELGLVAPAGDKGFAALRAEIAADTSLPAPAAEALCLLGAEIDRLEARLAQIDAKLRAQHKANADSRRLSAIPGISRCGSMRRSSARVGTSRPGSASCRVSIRPPASSAWAGSAGPGTNGCVSCSCSGQPRLFVMPSQGARGYRRGCSRCWSAGRASSRPWLWPTRWPASFGPC